MKSTVNEKTYIATFKHVSKPGLGKHKGEFYEETECLIRTPNDVGTLYTIGRGVARRKFTDTPNRVLGNHIALAKAAWFDHTLLFDPKVIAQFASQLRTPKG